MKPHWPFAWQITLHRLSWWPFALCIAVIAFWLAITQSEGAERNYLLTAVRTAEILVPLFAGMAAAYTFSPDDEPPLELMLAAPRPIRWAIIERLIALLAGYGLIGFLAIITIHTTFDNGNLTIATMLIRWLPPMVWFIGVGLYITIISRQGAFGALMVMIIWGTSLLSSGGLPEKYILIAPILPYLKQGALNITDQIYTINRITLIGAGLFLATFAIHTASDDERMLGIKRKELGIRNWKLNRKNFPISNLQSPTPAQKKST